jgi:hypothetical protein
MIFGVPVGMLELAFAVAAFVTAAELLTSQYPRTARFALQSVYFYAYVIIYGVLGAVGLALLPLVSDQVTIEGAGANNPWTKAALIGFSVKAILHIRVFSVATGPGSPSPSVLNPLSRFSSRGCCANWNWIISTARAHSSDRAPLG